MPTAAPVAEPAAGRRDAGREGEMQRVKAERKREAEPTAAQAAERPYYKIGEVCEITDTQPYVLRFWESEFPQLAPRKSRAGQRVYEKRDIDLILRIKKLLYQDEYTIAGARKKLEEEEGGVPPQQAGGPPAARKGEAHAAGKGPSAAEKRLVSALKALRQELREVKKILEP